MTTLDPSLRPIESLIPQRAPIVLVDRLTKVEAQKSYTTFTVPRGHLFLDDKGNLMQEGILEHIAQSAAARVGWLAAQKGEEVPLGFIGAISKAHFIRSAKVGETIETTVEVLQEVGPITLIGAESRVGEQLLVACEMKIYLNP